MRCLLRGVGAARMLYMSRALTVRSIFTSSTRFVDKNRMDEFTKKKSEYRIPGMDDDRVRERALLDIPMTIYFILGAWMMFLFFMVNKY